MAAWRIEPIDGIECAGAFYSAIDATNTLSTDGTRVPVRHAHGTSTVRDYRNGVLIVSWYNAVSTWRSSNFSGGGAATGSIYASYALFNSSAACVDFS